MRGCDLVFVGIALTTLSTAQRPPDTVTAVQRGDLYSLSLTTAGTEFDAAILDPHHPGTSSVLNCSLELRAENGTWEKVHDLKFVELGPRPAILKTKVSAGEWRGLCMTRLPHDGGTDGQCARLALRYGWQEGSAALRSEPFIIDAKGTLRSCGAH